MPSYQDAKKEGFKRPIVIIEMKKSPRGLEKELRLSAPASAFSHLPREAERRLGRGNTLAYPWNQGGI